MMDLPLVPVVGVIMMGVDWDSAIVGVIMMDLPLVPVVGVIMMAD